MKIAFTAGTLGFAYIGWLILGFKPEHWPMVACIWVIAACGVWSIWTGDA